MKCPTCGQEPKVARGDEWADGYDKGRAAGIFDGTRATEERLVAEQAIVLAHQQTIEERIYAAHEKGFEAGKEATLAEWREWLDKALSFAPDADEYEDPESSP